MVSGPSGLPYSEIHCLSVLFADLTCARIRSIDKRHTTNKWQSLVMSLTKPNVDYLAGSDAGDQGNSNHLNKQDFLGCSPPLSAFPSVLQNKTSAAMRRTTRSDHFQVVVAIPRFLTPIKTKGGGTWRNQMKQSRLAST